MSDSHYCQYAFAGPHCRLQQIGAGVDPRFEIEVVREGAGRRRGQPRRPGPVRLRPGCKARRPKTSAGWARSPPGTTKSSARRPPLRPCCRCGWGRFSGRAIHCGPRWCDAKRASPAVGQLGNRQEWGIKLIWSGGTWNRSRRKQGCTNGDCPPVPRPYGWPPPHFAGRRAGTAYLRREKGRIGDSRRAASRPACSRRFKTWNGVWRTRPTLLPRRATCPAA